MSDDVYWYHPSDLKFFLFLNWLVLIYEQLFFWKEHVDYPILCWLVIKLWIYVMATFFIRFIFFNLNPVSICPGILTNTRYIPRDFHARGTPSYLKAIVAAVVVIVASNTIRYFLSYIEIWSRGADSCKLIAKIFIE